jgi:hypothetical protein
MEHGRQNRASERRYFSRDCRNVFRNRRAALEFVSTESIDRESPEMARIEADKDDLMREAVALVRRVEFLDSEAAGATATETAVATTNAAITAVTKAMTTAAKIVIGFRASGWMSIYFGSDPMYQFDENGRLRRAFVGGHPFRTQGQTLARLTRHRTNSETTLLRHDLDDAELSAFRTEMLVRVTRLRDDLIAGRLAESKRIPKDDESLAGDVLRFLTMVIQSPGLLAPAIPGRP